LTYVIVSRHWADAGKSAEFTRFLEAVLDEGDAVARDENYVPLPMHAKSLVRVSLHSQFNLQKAHNKK
jgi:hypothetical protein